MAASGVGCRESRCSVLVSVEQVMFRLFRGFFPRRCAAQPYMAFHRKDAVALWETIGIGLKESHRAMAGLLSILALISGMGPAGCTTMNRVESVAEATVANEAGRRTFEEGVQAFQKKDYAKAMAFFEALSEDTSDQRLARSALYGLAVTKLTAASTPEEFRDALDLWECWRRQAPDGASGEDPRMLTPFLESVAPPGVSGGTAPKAEKSPKPVPNPNWTVYRGLLESRDREIERMKAKLDARDKEVRRLRQQIDSLEKIHLKYQEKKQGVSSP